MKSLNNQVHYVLLCKWTRHWSSSEVLLHQGMKKTDSWTDLHWHLHKRTNGGPSDLGQPWPPGPLITREVPPRVLRVSQGAQMGKTLWWSSLGRIFPRATLKRAAQFFIPTEDHWEGLLSLSTDGRSKEHGSEYFRVSSPVKTKHMTVFLSGHQTLGSFSPLHCGLICALHYIKFSDWGEFC